MAAPNPLNSIKPLNKLRICLIAFAIGSNWFLKDQVSTKVEHVILSVDNLFF